jgi:hypothetical protein
MPLFNVGFVIFPDLTQLDFTGPQQVLAPPRVRDAHRGKIGGSGAQRQWAQSRTHAHV